MSARANLLFVCVYGMLILPARSCCILFCCQFNAFDCIDYICIVSQPISCERTQYIIVITVEICKRHNRPSVFRSGKRPPVGGCRCRLVLISMQMNRRRQILTINCRRPKMSKRNSAVIIAVSASLASINDGVQILRASSFVSTTHRWHKIVIICTASTVASRHCCTKAYSPAPNRSLDKVCVFANN